MSTVTRCRCDDPLVGKYGPDQVCWRCWAIRHGDDGSTPQPETDQDRAAREAMESEPWRTNGYQQPYTGSEPPPHDDRQPNASTLAAKALEDSHVDLIAVISDGIPEPSYVPGCSGWLKAGSRYLVPAPAGTGKTLATLVVAVGVVEAGGTVRILDVENGAEEYARRLEDILAARDPDGTLAAACQQRLSYHAWPQLSLSWTAEEWAATAAGTDLVVFDSSRMALTSVGLAEDSADDYSKFIGQLVVPLSRAGTTTVILDNTGHDNQHRSRGTKAKEDLNEVVYRLAVIDAFTREHTGKVGLIRGRHRFSGLPRAVHIELGGGTYGPPVVQPEDEHGDGGGKFRPTRLMEHTSIAIEERPFGISNADLRDAVKGQNEAKALALRLLAEDGYIEQQRDGKTVLYHSLRPYREDD